MAISRFGTSSVAQGLPKYQKAWDQTTVLGNYYSIATVNGTGASSTITFSSIPTGYKHLEIRAVTRGTGSNTDSSDVKVRFNGDSTSGNYSWKRAQAYSTSTLTENGNLSDSGMNLCFALDGAAMNSAAHASVLIKITDYLNTSKRKTAFGLSMSLKNTGTSYGSITGGTWSSTAAITSISITNLSFNHSTTSTFELYGIK